MTIRTPRAIPRQHPGADLSHLGADGGDDNDDQSRSRINAQNSNIIDAEDDDDDAQEDDQGREEDNSRDTRMSSVEPQSEVDMSTNSSRAQSRAENILNNQPENSAANTSDTLTPSPVRTTPVAASTPMAPIATPIGEEIEPEKEKPRKRNEDQDTESQERTNVREDERPASSSQVPMIGLNPATDGGAEDTVYFPSRDIREIQKTEKVTSTKQDLGKPPNGRDSTRTPTEDNNNRPGGDEVSTTTSPILPTETPTTSGVTHHISTRRLPPFRLPGGATVNRTGQCVGRGKKIPVDEEDPTRPILTSRDLSDRAKNTSPEEENTFEASYKGARPKVRKEFQNRVRRGSNSGVRGSKSRSPSKATKERKDKKKETSEERRGRNLRNQLQRSLSFTSNEAHVATSPSQLPATLPHLSNPTSPATVTITLTDITQIDSLEVSDLANISLASTVVADTSLPSNLSNSFETQYSGINIQPTVDVTPTLTENDVAMVTPDSTHGNSAGISNDDQTDLTGQSKESDKEEGSEEADERQGEFLEAETLMNTLELDPLSTQETEEVLEVIQKNKDEDESKHQ